MITRDMSVLAIILLLAVVLIIGQLLENAKRKREDLQAQLKRAQKASEELAKASEKTEAVNEWNRKAAQEAASKPSEVIADAIGRNNNRVH